MASLGQREKRRMAALVTLRGGGGVKRERESESESGERESEREREGKALSQPTVKWPPAYSGVACRLHWSSLQDYQDFVLLCNQLKNL